MKLEIIILLITIPIELWYWLFYFPKSWKKESDKETKDLKFCLKWYIKHISKQKSFP